MIFQPRFGSEILKAHIAREGSVAGVGADVFLQSVPEVEFALYSKVIKC